MGYVPGGGCPGPCIPQGIPCPSPQQVVLCVRVALCLPKQPQSLSTRALLTGTSHGQVECVPPWVWVRRGLSTGGTSEAASRGSCVWLSRDTRYWNPGPCWEEAQATRRGTPAM